MIVGIDLGTTNSLLAVWEDGAPRLVPNALGSVLTPSCVGLDEDGTVLVGQAAKERLQTRPDCTASVFKRHMGTDRVVKLGGRSFRPEELSSLVLRSLKEDAEAALGRPVTEAIVTVPAYFSDAQRKATRAAAQMAGLKVDRLLNEPTAASLAYGIHMRDQEAKFLVFDLGGGTFDVSILDLFEGVMEVRASSGDNFLGGEDFVNLVLDWALREGTLPVDLRSRPGDLQRAMAALEALKVGLSTQERARIPVRLSTGEHEVALDQATFEVLCAPLLQRLRDPVERAIRDARMRPEELDAIVLAGGATRMPLVRALVRRMFGREPLCELNPDEVVALGAAVQAGLKMKDAALQEIVMTDVAPYSLGVEVSMDLGSHRSDGHFDPVIERNSVVPVSRVKTYAPTSDHQPWLDLRIFQGEARMVRDNLLLGNLKIKLPGLPRQDCAVEVRFTYDVNGLLEVEATLAHNKATHRLVIRGNAGILTDEEIEERLKALAALKIHPRDKVENRTFLARGDRIYSLLVGREREAFGLEMARFEQVLAGQDDRAILDARRRLAEIMDLIEADLLLDVGPVQ